MKRHILPLLLCLASLPILAQYNSYNLPKANGKITIDGKLDEPDWQNKPLISEFHPFNLINSEMPETKVWMVQEEEYLVIAVESMEEFPGALVARASHDGSVWTDDHVEFFFDTTGDRKSCVQILVNSKGTLADGILKLQGLPADWSWECNAEVKTAVLADRWILEMRIPFSSFPPITPGADWPFHVARSRYTMNTMHMTSLKAKLKGFHEMQYFDALCGIRCDPTGIVVKRQAFNSLEQVENELPFYEGSNIASLTLVNENSTPKEVVASIDTSSPERTLTVTKHFTLPANSTTIANIPWICTLDHEETPISLRMEMDGRRLQSFSTIIKGIQPILGNLRMNAVSYSQTAPAVVEFPINLAVTDGNLVLLWELWSDDASKMLVSGQTRLSSKEMKLRIFKSFMKPAIYRLRRFIIEDGKTIVISREDKLAITASPWDN